MSARRTAAWAPWLLALLGAAASPGSQLVEVPFFLPTDESQTVIQNKQRLRDRATAEAVRQVCGEDVEDTRLLALTGDASDVQRTFLRRTSVRARGRVLDARWKLEPRAEAREGRDGYGGVLQAEVVCEPPRPPAFSLDLGIRGAKPDLLPLFKVGETVELTCRASTRARAMLFALGSDQRVVPVVPSPYLRRLDLAADAVVSVPGPEDRVTLEVSAPPTPGTWLEAFKLVAFKGDVLPPPPATGPDGTIAPADFEKWLFKTPAEVREEAVVAYQVVGQEVAREP
jgi:hypothetical protein